MKKKIFLAVLMIGLLSPCYLLRADSSDPEAVANAPASTDTSKPDENTAKSELKPVADKNREKEDLINMDSSYLKNRMDQLERRMSDLERNDRSLDERLRNLDRSVDDLKRRR